MTDERTVKIVVIDIDNTIVDTAVRKQQILAQILGSVPDIDEVRKDFWLEGYLGRRDSNASMAFYSTLDSELGIDSFPAPALDGAARAIQSFIEQGLKVVLVSNRPNALEDATRRELARLQIDLNQIDLFLSPEQVAVDDLGLKTRTITRLEENSTVVCVIGDRPEDVFAAYESRAPAVLIDSTVTTLELEQIWTDDRARGADSFGLTVCRGWSEIRATVSELLRGIDLFSELRSEFTHQYDRWLSDIDNKCQTVVLVAAALAAVTGNLLVGATKHRSPVETVLLACGFAAALLSSVYAIRALTARHTSGSQASRSVGTSWRLWIGALLGLAGDWTSSPGDAVSDYNQARIASPLDKRLAHIRFFHSQYGTYDPDAILNLRMLELRATNYAKVYAERCASGLLMVGLTLVVVSLVFRVI